MGIRPPPKNIVISNNVKKIFLPGRFSLTRAYAPKDSRSMEYRVLVIVTTMEIRKERPMLS